MPIAGSVRSWWNGDFVILTARERLSLSDGARRTVALQSPGARARYAGHRVRQVDAGSGAGDRQRAKPS